MDQGRCHAPSRVSGNARRPPQPSQFAEEVRRGVAESNCARRIKRHPLGQGGTHRGIFTRKTNKQNLPANPLLVQGGESPIAPSCPRNEGSIISIDGKTVKLTHLNKVYWPEEKFHQARPGDLLPRHGALHAALLEGSSAVAEPPPERDSAARAFTRRTSSITRTG